MTNADDAPGTIGGTDATTDAIAGGTDEASLDATDPGRARRRARLWAGGFVLAVLVAVTVTCAFVQVPYYRFSPGTLYPTEPAITVNGATAFTDPGTIEYTTVSQKKATVLEAALARFDPAVELVDEDLVDGDRTQDETRQLNLEMMRDAKQTASIVALRELGYPVQLLGTGAVIRSVGAGMPADGVLEKNDTLVKIDDTPITTADDAIKALARHHPGDEVTLTFEPPPDLDTGHEGPTRTASVVLAARPDDANRPMLGVELGTRSPQYKPPFTIDIDSKNVGGPSAGLAFTLGIIDVLTPGSLSGGQNVAVTGTIDINGAVGPIGGIRQKTFLAQRNGATLFIVPKDEEDEARKWATPDLRIVGVSTIDEALAALHDNGGSTEVVQQEAAARTATTAN